MTQQTRIFPVQVTIDGVVYRGSATVTQGKVALLRVEYGVRSKALPLGQGYADVLAQTMLEQLVREAQTSRPE